MHFNGLFLASAAAVVAASGARAADAVVVAEPEPVEYVRVCDVYGTGFYYMPGTETCLSVGGYVRYDIGVGYLGFEDVIDKKDLVEDGTINLNDTYYKRARAALQIDARTETELGTLRAYSQINFQFDSTVVEEIDGSITATEEGIEIEHAYIELGGFLIGETDSFFSTFGDYAGAVIQDDLVPYGPFATHTIQYKFDAGNGLTFGAALEEGADEFTIDSYVPHIAAGAKYAQDWGGISVVAGYDFGLGRVGRQGAPRCEGVGGHLRLRHRWRKIRRCDIVLW